MKAPKIPFLAPKTTDGVLAAFRKAVDELQAVSAQHLTIASEKEAQAVAASRDAVAARAEAHKANAAATRLQAIFGEAA